MRALHLGAPWEGGEEGGARSAPQAAAVRALRPPKPANDPWRHQGVTVERERAPGGGFVSSATVFLTGAECPFTCIFCDLWRYTIDGPTPEGALPLQLRQAVEELPALLRDAGLDRCEQIKLYNASNFFEPRAVPEVDREPIARLVDGFARVVVECHPRLVDDAVGRFADRIEGRLEVAMGLETAHPEALPRLGKRLTLDQFDRAAKRLEGYGVDLRVFVLVGAPHVPVAEQAEWVGESVRHAASAGARSVALIPARHDATPSPPDGVSAILAEGGTELERLREQGAFEPPDLALLEESLALGLEAAGPSVAVQVDPWDLDRVRSGCATCRAPRVRAIREMNRTGAPRRTVCDECGR